MIDELEKETDSEKKEQKHAEIDEKKEEKKKKRSKNKTGGRNGDATKKAASAAKSKSKKNNKTTAGKKVKVNCSGCQRTKTADKYIEDKLLLTAHVKSIPLTPQEVVERKKKGLKTITHKTEHCGYYVPQDPKVLTVSRKGLLK
jgi:hypothetical protein